MTAFRTATETAERLRRKETTSRELVEAMLARIDEVNPSLNAVVELRREDALREADEADAELAGGAALGPLHGVPVTVKDSFAVTGLHTTWGNPAFADSVADWDATLVRRLRDAGAIVVGKTNVHFMLADFGQTANEVYGRTNNPWDPTRTPGGSTGGGAAALAAGLTALDYGSDLVGSIRIPATFCGVYGLKPTNPVVPLTGFQPPGPPVGPSERSYLSAVGPLARSAADLRTALAVTAGPDDESARAYTWKLPPPRHSRLGDFRIGVVLDHPAAPVTAETGAVLSNTVDALSRAGAHIVTGWPDGVDPVRDAETFGFHVGLFFAHQGQGDEPAGVVEQEARRMAVRAAWSEHFGEVDVFLCPVNFTAAFAHDDRPFEERMIGDVPYAAQSFWVSHASLAGLPALSAPAGRTAAGLPVGAQIVGPRYEDDTAITFAELAAEVLGGFEPPGS